MSLDFMTEFARHIRVIRRTDVLGVGPGGLVADRMVEDSGLHGMRHSAFVAPEVEGDWSAGIIVESKAGREAILALGVIDARDVVDVAMPCGAPAEHMPAARVMFHLAGVNKAELMAAAQAVRSNREVEMTGVQRDLIRQGVRIQ